MLLVFVSLYDFSQAFWLNVSFYEPFSKLINDLMLALNLCV